MKGFNLKKLAIIAAGAALVGSAVAPIAAAALTDLTKSDVIDATGAPVVDIVVGSKAAVSDVVWAGNIAAKLAQLATKTASVTGGSGTGTPNVTNLSVTLAVGGTTTVTGGKTYFSDMNSASLASAETNFTDQNVTQSNVPSLKYYGSKTYTWNNTSYSTTMQEKLNFTSHVIYDNSTNRAIIAKVLAGKLKYVVDLGSGIPYNEAPGSGAKFTDDKNDNILVPFFGKDYLVKEVSQSSGYIELVETNGEKDYKDGDKIEGLTDANGNAFYISVGAGAVSGSTNKIKLDLYDATDTKVDGGYYSSGDITFYKNGSAFLQTSVNVSDILKATVSNSDVFTATIYLGTSRLQLYDSKGYPYDASKAADAYDYTTALTWDTAADKNKLLKIEIVNSSNKVWNASTALKIGGTIDFPNKVGTLKLVGLQLPGMGATKSERTTSIVLGNSKLSYKDSTYEANHEIPFYLNVGDLSSSQGVTFSEDGKIFYAKASIGDVNIWASDSTGGRVATPSATQCLGDGNYVNGQVLHVSTISLSGQSAKFADKSGNTTRYVGEAVDLNGMQFTFSGINTAANNCVYLTADGNLTIRKDSSVGTIVQEVWYVDKNAASGARVTLVGASDVTAKFTPMVYLTSGSTVARVFLFMSDQNFVTQYNKYVELVGTDTAEDESTAVNFYLPNSVDLPTDYNGGSTFNVNNYHVAKFKIDEAQENGSAYDYNVFVDAQNGNLIALPNAQLGHYGYEVGYYQAERTDGSHSNWQASENTTQSYPKDAYSDFGGHLTLSSHIMTLVSPENKPQLEILVSGTGTVISTTGGETLVIDKGSTKSTSGGTTIEVKDVNYTAVCGAGTGACTPSEFEQVVSVGKLVYTDDSPPSGKVIIVGGHLVNTLAKGVTDDLLTKSGDVVAEKEANGDIVVAGFTAADTGTAAQQLIDALDALVR